MSTAPSQPVHSGIIYKVTATAEDKMVMAGQQATFELTAYTSGGKPAAHQPVSFWIGPMVPLSGIPPKDWYQTGTQASMPYVVSYSQSTNQSGQAFITLKGQPAKSMEMIAVRIGNISTFNTMRQSAAGQLDAWWTTPNIVPGAPVGDSVTVNPFLIMDPNKKPVPLTVTVDSPQGPIANAMATFTPKTGASPMMGTSGSGMSSQGGTTLVTNAQGTVRYTAMLGSSSSILAVRIVATEGNAMMRVAGGMNAEIIAK